MTEELDLGVLDITLPDTAQWGYIGNEVALEGPFELPNYL